MKKLDLIEKKLEEDKELLKAIQALSFYSTDTFINDCLAYISAIKEGRMVCSIYSVSRSGMSRTIAFHAIQKLKRNPKTYRVRQFVCFFMALGYRHSRDDRFKFVIGGCGMDMIFHTNYTIINKLARLGFLSNKERDVLAQATPTVL